MRNFRDAAYQKRFFGPKHVQYLKQRMCKFIALRMVGEFFAEFPGGRE
jgi:hypothetical protein